MTTTPEQDQANQTTENPAEEPVTETPDEQPNTDEQPRADELTKARKEAAGRRRELRDSEAAAQEITEQLTQMRREKLATHMEQHKSFRPELLELVGHDPSEFFAEDGTLDEKTLTEAIKTVSKKYGIFTGDKVKYVNLGETGPTNTPDWTTALKGNHTR